MSTHIDAGGISMTQGKSSSLSAGVEWSSLPYELLAMVHSKVASPRDRIRFAAVCRPWGAAVSRALPLLLLSPSDMRTEKRIYCPEDGGILRVPVPRGLQNMCFNGSYDGGWIAAGTRNRIAIVNLFSGIEVALSEKQRSISCMRHYHGSYFVWKIIFSEAPTSSTCILAAMTDGCNIALCRVGCPDGGWTIEGCERQELGDIAFCQGELYGLTRCSEKLLWYHISENKDGAPVVTYAHKLNVKRRDGPRCKSKYSYDYTSYIFELRGKLAMAVMIQWSQNRKAFFKVFELTQTDADDDAHDYKWVELHSLGEYTLFLGPAFSSRVFHMAAGSRGGIEKNRIYYSHHRSIYTKQDKECDKKAYLTRSVSGDRMYCIEDQNDGSQITALGYYVIDGPYVPMWCFPPRLLEYI